MSIYNFAPMPVTVNSDVDYAVWRNGFTPEELDKIVSYCDANLPKDKAIIAGLDKEAEYAEIRKSKTAWVGLNEETVWLYDRLAYIARQVNAEYWRFDLSGFIEDFQYTLYDEKDDHYTWHVDAIKNAGGMTPRKLSMVLQLSEPEEYLGGDLQLLTSATEQSVPKERGLVTLFPSYALHRVTPIESGIRRSLVVWVAGPPFK